MSRRYTLDARRLLCPMPVIKVQGFLTDLAPGDRVSVLCTDPGTRHDIPAWCRVNGHRVVEIQERGGELRLLVEVGGEAGAT